jgi:hypothetical protein
MVLVLVNRSRLLNPFVFKSSRYKVGTKQRKKARGQKELITSQESEKIRKDQKINCNNENFT